MAQKYYTITDFTNTSLLTLASKLSQKTVKYMVVKYHPTLLVHFGLKSLAKVSFKHD